MKNISLRIADASGKFVAGFDKLTSTKYQDFVVAKTGAYYAVVTGIGNGVGGRYNLSFGATGGSDGAGVPEGSYRAADGTICTVDNVKIQGRTQSYLGCDRPSGTYHFELSVVSGSVSSGHPYLPQLVNYGVDPFSWRCVLYLGHRDQ